MADLTITAADVEFGNSRQRFSTVQAGEAMTAGQVCYLNTDGKYYTAVATSEAAAAVAGVVMKDVSLDGYFPLGNQLEIVSGGTMVKGEYYFVSATAGAVCPHDDLVSTNYVSRVYFAETTTSALLDLKATGVTI